VVGSIRRREDGEVSVGRSHGTGATGDDRKPKKERRAPSSNR